MNKTTGEEGEKPRSVWVFEEQRGTERNVIGADSGSRQSPAQGEKALSGFAQKGF